MCSSLSLLAPFSPLWTKYEIIIIANCNQFLIVSLISHQHSLMLAAALWNSQVCSRLVVAETWHWQGTTDHVPSTCKYMPGNCAGGRQKVPDGIVEVHASSLGHHRHPRKDKIHQSYFVGYSIPSVLETNMVDLHLESTCGLKEVSTTSSLITDESILGIKDKPILIATVWFDLWPY